jgi:hypothetical protein
MDRVSRAQINLPTHSAYVTVNVRGTISVFKANNKYCEYEQFTNQLDAGDYILEPLPSIQYYIQFPEEE